MSNQVVEVEYYSWLLDKIDYYEEDYNPGHSYNQLLEQLFNSEFYWTVPNDDNRAADGIALRTIFTDEEGWNSDPLEGAPCSMLEMLVALSMKIESEVMWNGDENRTSEWFWMMIRNLNLDQFYDQNFDLDQFLTILDQFLTRNYEKSGQGGLFPLHEKGVKNQQKVEIWYQMQAFLMENYVF